MIATRLIMSGMWLQDTDSISSGNSKLLMIFIGLVALALLVQAGALVVMAIGAAKARKRGLAIVEEVRAKAIPAIDSTQEFVKNYAPKLMTLAENMVETSNLVRKQAQEFDTTLSDVNIKARAQAAKADEVVSTALNGTAEILAAVQHGIRVPVRELTGWVNGLKAGLDVLVGRSKNVGGYGRTTYSQTSRSARDNDIDL
jgi:hypothetical protein